MSEVERVKIVQYNVQKSYGTMSALLQDPGITQYDILAIQEPWLNSQAHGTTHNPTKGMFTTYLAAGEGPAFIGLLYGQHTENSVSSSSN